LTRHQRTCYKCRANYEQEETQNKCEAFLEHLSFLPFSKQNSRKNNGIMEAFK